MAFSLTKSRWLSLSITLVVVLLAGFATLQLWQYYMESPWTRDGRVRADVLQVAPDVSGRIINLAVHDNEAVSKGQLLFTIDASSYKIAVARAEAEKLRLKAEMEEKLLEYQRRQRMAHDLISVEAKDQAKLAYQSAKAQFEAAQAALAQAKLDLQHTQVYAPANGFITNLNRYQGDYASIGQPVLSLVDSDSFYVYGYFLETQLPQIKPGAGAQITLLGQDNTPLRGEVVSIARGIADYSNKGDSVELHRVNPTFDWVRLAMRVPVRIKLLHVPEGVTLAAGMTCTVVIN